MNNGVIDMDKASLVTGAAGGVGTVALALLSRLGYQVIASTGRPTAARMIAMATSDAEGIPATPIEVTSAITTIVNCTPKPSSRP